MNPKLRSMRARMTVLFTVFVALLMLVGGAAVQRREERRAAQRVDEILTVALERARAEVAEDEQENKSLLQIAQTDESELAAGGLVLVVIDADKVVWKAHQHAPEWPLVGDDWRVQTLSYQGQTLVLAQEWVPIRDGLEETEMALWQLGALIVGATGLAAWFVVGRTLSPLNKLASQAQNASIESLQVRLESPSSDAEMLHLTQTLNDLLSRLEKEALTRGRFYAAASHELRTPIQALLGQIDVALSRPRSVAAHEEILERLQDETERLAALVQDLLQLNALEMRQSLASREMLNIAFWIQRALSQQAGVIEQKGLIVEAKLEDAEIEAPPAHVEILLRNLLENAVKYARPTSPLRVEIKEMQNGARLQIWNACEVPADAHIEDWFEPFYRPDESRNSQTGGNGLGLSIVAALTRTHHWKIELQARDGGVEALVNFPKY